MVALDVLAGNLSEQHLHLVIECGVVGGCSHDKAAIAEDVAQDVGVVGFRHVVDHDVLHAGIAGGTGYLLGHALGVAIHGAVADDEAGLGLVARQAVVETYHLIDIFVPHGAVGRADVVEMYVGQLLQRVLHGRAVFAHDVRIVAHHLQPERVAVNLRVDDTAVQGAEAAEGVA